VIRDYMGTELAFGFTVLIENFFKDCKQGNL
jgi:hypothetical protein